MEEFLPQLWPHWQLAFGLALLALVLRAPRGLAGLVPGSQPGSEPGTQPGPEPGTQPGPEPGSEPGTRPK
jgi:hypothetical protein